MRIQSRDLQVLKSLAKLRILDRDQISTLCGFHSITRVNLRLAKLKKSGLIMRYVIGSSTGSNRSIYTLARKGAEVVGATYAPPKWKPDSVVIGNAFVAHQLVLNDVHILASQIANEQTLSWSSPQESLSPSVKLVPDALLEIADSNNQPLRSLFLEVDLGTESLPRWTKKVQGYLKLATSGEFRRIVHTPSFGVLVVANSEARMELLRTHIAKITRQLFWFTTLETIKQRGFWSDHWLRPAGDRQAPPGA